ncbi:nuA3 HAT complex component nto1 [Scheffersomyces spartinae]|uniref:NuA3 HAT complex component nto1 n=1 Tax=Scheffersomyces spartinae TaxID=45513 RepID=A0A9P7VA37_9ASCO|nr:nuA3 HAT complex component nto1 [Scheffersomyces spartinae]KAG7194153.1 nuA3 HAT complex component nto1 [Scheffersomyces spartinae]
MGIIYLDSNKPREEQDYHEIYSDLDEADELEVIFEYDDSDSESDTINHRLEGFTSKLKQPVFREVLNGPMDVPKFPKSLLDFGFQEPRTRLRKTPTSSGIGSGQGRGEIIPYIRPFQFPDVKDVSKVADQKRSLVCYDLDEQDFCYLQHRNKGKYVKLTLEVFEIMMSVLEVEWQELEMRMQSLNPTVSPMDDRTSNTTLALDDEKYGNDDGIVSLDQIDDQKCAICNESDCENLNAIVFCDGCNIAVHQECYGVAFIPEGQWLCRKCMISRHSEVDCIFCPSKTGAFKQLDNSLWSHVVCALWINELYFANPIYMEPIEGLDLIPKSRWRLNCYICKQKKGACIQCYNRSCFQAYHVTCAKRSNLYMKLTNGITGAIRNKASLLSFCDKHTPAGYLNQSEIHKSIHKTRLFFKDKNILKEQNMAKFQHQQLTNRLNNLKWKTSKNTPIPPNVFSDKLYEILTMLKIETMNYFVKKLNAVKGLTVLPNISKEDQRHEVRQICNEVCRYWCLKRELKNGAPLIRRNNNMESMSSVLYGANNRDEINRKIEFSDVLARDLDKLLDMVLLTSQRQKQMLESSTIRLDTVNLTCFYLKSQIEEVLNNICKKVDGSKSLIEYEISIDKLSAKLESDGGRQLSLFKIMEKNYAFGYTQVSELKDDLDRLFRAIQNKLKPISLLHKTAKKWYREFNENGLTQLLEAEKISQFGVPEMERLYELLKTDESARPATVEPEASIKKRVGSANPRRKNTRTAKSLVVLRKLKRTTEKVEEESLSDVEDLSEEHWKELINFIRKRRRRL